MGKRLSIGLLLLGCAVAAGASVGTSPPLPTVKKHWSKPVSGVTQGAGALALIAKPKIPTLTTNSVTFVWQYPSTINPSLYWWNIETSTDLRNWTIAISNASGHNTINVKQTDALRLYRLSGRNTP